MSSFAELLRAIALIMWPLLAASVVFFYREELRAVLKRISHFRKAKLFGQEIEITEEVDLLQRSVVETTAEIVATPAASLAGPKETSPDDNLEETLLGNPAQSPKVALILLGSKIEHRLRLLAASTGWPLRSNELSASVEVLERQGSLPRHAIETVRLFSSVRSKLVHGGDATEHEILRAIDSGINLLKAIDSIPVATHTVVRADVPIYSDAACTKLRGDVKGLILEETSALMPNKFVQIFPTTKTHFQVGQQVAWEWNMSNVWGESWHRSTDTNEILPAWSQSAEFIGRPLDTL